MPDIFVSYSRKDLERVKPIVQELLHKGWSVFWDLEIPPGETWRGYIKKKLDDSTCVLVVWSQFSISSDWVIAEADEAKKRGVMVPILLDVVEPPFGFSHIHSADISCWNSNGAHPKFLQCVEAIAFRLSRTVGVMSRSDVVPSSVSPIVLPQIPPNFVFIRGGEFTMGSFSYEPDRGSDEDQHQVRVSDFYMGRFAVTQADWRSVTGTNPSTFQGENLPVECVSWNDCQAFIQALNRQTGKTYRLPTEAEWEYACRAGTITPFNTGGNLATDEANYNGNYPYNKNQKGQYREKTVAVDSFAPNAWGLYNMHGNVWEWCSDWYDSNYYAACKSKGVVTNPENMATGSNRVLRGGSWDGGAGGCRSAARYDYSPDYRNLNVGFRLVFVP